ncbi:hypothetical protein Tco_1281549, partial [Tanacetum coccineum]
IRSAISMKQLFEIFSNLISSSCPHGSSHIPQVSTAHDGPSSSSESSATRRTAAKDGVHLTVSWISIELIFTLGQIVATISSSAILPLSSLDQATSCGSNQSQQLHSVGNNPPYLNSSITISSAPSPDDGIRPTTSTNTSTDLNVVGTYNVNGKHALHSPKRDITERRSQLFKGSIQIKKNI